MSRVRFPPPHPIEEVIVQETQQDETKENAEAISGSGYLARARRTQRGSNGGTTRLPPGKCWAPHEGYGARLRRHKQAWAQFEKLCKTDGYAKVTRERLLDYVAEMNQRPDVAEIAAMGIVLASRVRAGELKITWTAALNEALNELEKAAVKVDPTRGVEVKIPK